ncbi:MAG: radical SAM protein [Coriobacteriia bacterium]|nr:radical SAM protein [Coriobacteriia bacterium]
MLLTSALRVLLTRSFKPFVFRNVCSEQLVYQGLNNLGLYVHIPFCRSICSFCPYFKVPFDQGLAAEYKAALLKEIDLVCASQSERKRATSLYFGGGTPALMLDDLAEIIDKLKEYFEITDGIGVELHPDDINDHTLQKLAAAGVTMLSLGIQSFDSDCLQALGRHNDDFISKLQLVRRYGFAVVDVDLIFGIPRQTEESFLNDITTAFEHGATQVSTYPFIDFTYANNQYKPVSEREKKKILSAIVRHCADAGIERTSVWTFAKQGTSRYSSVTRDSFLGFGPSATTLLRDSFKINTFSIPDYIKRVETDHLPTSLTLDFTKRGRACYYLFWACYSMWIDNAAFTDMMGISAHKMYGFELWLGEKLGFWQRESGGYRLTNTGAYHYHRLEQAYTTAYIDKSWNISRLQPFPEKIVLR